MSLKKCQFSPSAICLNVKYEKFANVLHRLSASGAFLILQVPSRSTGTITKCGSTGTTCFSSRFFLSLSLTLVSSLFVKTK